MLRLWTMHTFELILFWCGSGSQQNLGSELMTSYRSVDRDETELNSSLKVEYVYRPFRLHYLFTRLLVINALQISFYQMCTTSDTMMASIQPGNRGGKVLIHGGYRYQKNKAQGKKMYWRCWRKACGAFLQTAPFDV